MELAVEKADFGPGKRTIVRKSDQEKGAHFASSVEFFTVKCGEKEIKVVGKVQPADPYTRALMHSDLQFANEVLMYKEVLPLLKMEQLFPRIYYGSATGNHIEDTILLEDMSVDGYRVTKEKLFLSVDHFRLALTELGKFHAASFVAKATEKERFDDIKSRLQFRPFDDPDGAIDKCLARGITPLLDQHGDILKPLLKAMQDERLLQILTKAREPWGVMCHGDFCRNNIMFKYDGDKPISVKFFDLQTSQYTSPAIDLSFFLYLNSDKETRDKHWDELLKLYLDSLKSSLPAGTKIDEEGFYEDFASRAVYGYFHCSFFKPMMMLDTPPGMEDYSKFTPEQRVQMMLEIGGEEGTRLVSDVIEHLLQKGYVQKFLDLYNSSIKN